MKATLVPRTWGLAKSDGDFGEVSMISMWLQSMKVIAIVRNFERLQVHTFFLTKVPTVQNPCRTLLVCAWSFSGYENLIDRLQPQVCFTAVHKTRVVWTSGLLFCILGMSLRRVLILNLKLANLWQLFTNSGFDFTYYHAWSILVLCCSHALRTPGSSLAEVASYCKMRESRRTARTGERPVPQRGRSGRKSPPCKIEYGDMVSTFDKPQISLSEAP